MHSGIPPSLILGPYDLAVMAVRGQRALIVTTGRSRGSLAALRALSEAGWYVGVGIPETKGMVTTSKWCRHRHLIPRPRGDAEEFVAALAEAVAIGEYDVVFGGGDDTVAALAAARDRIPARVAHPPIDRVIAALDKIELATRARAVGLAAPRTEVATEATLSRWVGPVVVKCRSHFAPGQHHEYRIEARRYPNAERGANRVRRIRDAGLVPTLQQVVDGQLGAIIGVMHDGRLLGRVQQAASALWPVPNGVSSRAETIPVDEDLAGRAEALLAGLGWEGLVELQFLTPPGCAAHLIDLNGRFYGSMALANEAGANLADAWARQALGLPLPPLSDAQIGVRFAWTAGDLRRAFAERRGGLLGDVRTTFGWARQATASSVWDRHDVRPALHLLLAAVIGRTTHPFDAARPRQPGAAVPAPNDQPS